MSVNETLLSDYRYVFQYLKNEIWDFLSLALLEVKI